MRSLCPGRAVAHHLSYFYSRLPGGTVTTTTYIYPTNIYEHIHAHLRARYGHIDRNRAGEVNQVLSLVISVPIWRGLVWLVQFSSVRFASLDWAWEPGALCLWLRQTASVKCCIISCHLQVPQPPSPPAHPHPHLLPQRNAPPHPAHIHVTWQATRGKGRTQCLPLPLPFAWPTLMCEMSQRILHKSTESWIKKCINKAGWLSCNKQNP